MGFVTLLLSQEAEEQRFITALRSAGAISPATAQPVATLHVNINDPVWLQLLMQGRIREGTPGHFYLFELPRARRRERVIKMLVFWALILLIPVVLIMMSTP